MTPLNHISSSPKRDSTNPSHLKPHLNEMVPVYFNSTICVGFFSSRILVLLVADGAVAVTRRDSDKGSLDSGWVRIMGYYYKAVRVTINLDLIFWGSGPLFPIVQIS